MRKKTLLKSLFALFLFFGSAYGIEFKKVVIWGHKLHTHTHSYIHDAFYKAFKHLNYEVYHFDNSDNVSSFDFSNTLFLTEGQADQKIPLREDCYYILHNCTDTKYKDLFALNRCIILQVYTDDVLTRDNCVLLKPFIYEDVEDKTIYMPWATDLLPYEIEENKKLVNKSNLEKYVKKFIFWCGTYSDGEFGNQSELLPFIQAAAEAGIKFFHRTNLDPKEMAKHERKAYMAPAIVGEWQKKNGYIPCRIFKNISNGQMGITNSYHVYELFEKKIVYDCDTRSLFFKAKEAKASFTKEKRAELMDFVKNNHTYINRIEELLDFFERTQSVI